LTLTGILSLFIFAFTLILMIKRPKGLNLGLAAGIGAIISLLLGTVTLGDAVQSFANIWDAALAFVGIIALSVILDAMGFFKWAALRVVSLAKGNGIKLYFYVTLLTATVSVLFANDSAILILIPIVLEVVSQIQIDQEGKLAYLFSAGLIADTAAMPLITSNPVNIVSADFFKYTFIDHLIFMGPIAIATILTSLLVVYTFFRKKIPKTYCTDCIKKMTTQNLITPFQLRISIATLVAVDIGYVLTSLNRFPVSFIICAGALFLLFVYIYSPNTSAQHRTNKKPLTQLAREINWDILLFMISIFLVVQGLKNAGVINLFASLLTATSALPSALSTISSSFVVTIGASFMNNWPMTILGLFSIKQAALTTALAAPAMTGLIFSNIIGNNLGPHFFPFGSLAILMWLEIMRKKGIKINLTGYLKIGAILSIIEVLVAALILWIEIGILGLHL
jgi:arsenical pump membrane protein